MTLKSPIAAADQLIAAETRKRKRCLRRQARERFKAKAREFWRGLVALLFTVGGKS